MTQARTSYDVVIVGGGLVGASLACALSGHGLTIGVVEAVSPRAGSQPSYDDRTLALALASVRIFDALGVWSHLRDRATAIDQVHVSSQGQWGMTRFTAAEMGVEALGYVAEAREVGRALYDRLADLPDCELRCPARVTALRDEADHVELDLEQDSETSSIRCRLVVAADGAQSMIRDLRHIAFEVHDYNQVALIANVTPQLSHANCAYERFTPTGQLAVLPHVGRRCGLVWVLPAEQAQDWLACEEAEFLSEVQKRFGFRLGYFQRLGTRASYPLRMGKPETDIGYRTILIGNAAHTVHPVAAQGFNLGLRDVALLAENLVAAARNGTDLGEARLCQDYSQARARDQQGMMQLTDGLVRVFTHPSGLVRAGRSLGLLGMAMSPTARRQLARRTMGFAGTVPRLAREKSL